MIQPSPVPPESFVQGDAEVRRAALLRSRSATGPLRLLIVLGVALGITSVLSRFTAGWLGFPPSTPTYRRIGPETGPQVYCAGSSLLQFGLSWNLVSEKLGEGIENWGLGGSSPSEWEIFQSRETNANMLVVGVSLYDLNEERLCDARANTVPFFQTVRDLAGSHAGWQYAKRVLSQYPLACLRGLFPTAGKSDAVLVGLRMKFRQIFKLSSAADDRARVAFLPNQAVLEFGEMKDKVSDWPEARALRRIAAMRGEIHNAHDFDGLKNLAFHRMLQKAHERGRILVVVLPVSHAYREAFVTSEVEKAFDKTLSEAQQIAPDAQMVRLDQIAELDSNDYFSDLVHLNTAGKNIATEVFFKAIKQEPGR